MNHGSLFSGIGGFDLASEWVGWNNVFQVEIDPFCQKILTKHFPNATRYRDIKEFDGTRYRGTVDIISGGFPCQPFSVAGKQRGNSDDRYLWPEMLRVIREVQPTWVVGENVSGIIKLALDQVLSDLENEGYACQTFLIPACGKNAPHRRERIWVVAYSGCRQQGECRNPDEMFIKRNCEERTTSEACRSNSNAPNPSKPRLPKPGFTEIGEFQKKNTEGLDNRFEQQNSNVTNTNEINGNNAGYGTGEISQFKEAKIQGCDINTDPDNSTPPRFGQYSGSILSNAESKRPNIQSWEESWFEVATRLCRVSYGFSDWLDRNRNGVKYGATYKEITEQNLPELWQNIQQEKIWETIRGCDPFLKEEILQSFLCGVKPELIKQENLQPKGEKIQEELLRTVQYNEEFRYTSPKWRLDRQQPKQSANTLSSLSSQIALEVVEAWNAFIASRPKGWRVNALKTGGNAIVPQVAFELFQAIDEITKVVQHQPQL
jgi:DNA-cytosine methyltransferase